VLLVLLPLLSRWLGHAAALHAMYREPTATARGAVPATATATTTSVVTRAAASLSSLWALSTVAAYQVIQSKVEPWRVMRCGCVALHCCRNISR
jgi:hypothetical protein